MPSLVELVCEEALRWTQCTMRASPMSPLRKASRISRYPGS